MVEKSGRMQCPHCKSYSSCTATKVMTEVTRSKIYRCSNIECGHVFETFESVSRTLVMSASPNPGLSIPFSETLVAAVKHAAQFV